MRKRLTAMVLMLVCILGLLGTFDRQTIYAKENGRFTGEVTILKEETDSYVLQIVVGNTGEDFDGTIRLMFGSTDDDGGCAFDRKITLPAQGEKQYTLTVPSDCLSSSRGSGQLFFLDSRGVVLDTVAVRNVLGASKSVVTVGVLSDQFDKLSYMDMGGETLTVDTNYDAPINLVELDAKNLESSLDGIYFLIIDQYDLTTLDDSVINAIEDWVKDGGWLILGTGERYEEVLGAFDSDFLGISYGEVSQRGTENKASIAAANRSSYSLFAEDGIDLTQMALLDVEYDNTGYNANSVVIGGYDSDSYPGTNTMVGKGAVTVLAFSLTEDVMQVADTVLLYSIYDETMCNSQSYTINYNYFESSYLGQQAFGIIDHKNTNVDFSWLKILIVCYVILVGPVLYLVLGARKKKEWYWLAVPVAGVVFIGAVFLFGKNLRVMNTKVYSVSVQCADGKDDARVDTLYSGYHSGVKPWSIRLADNYSYGGTNYVDYSSFISTYTSSDYHYLVSYDDGLSLGLKPASNFETGYFCAIGTGSDCGQITTQDLVVNSSVQSGSITNGTSYDFPYMMVQSTDSVLLLSDVKAGETVDLEQAADSGQLVTQISTSYLEDVYYDILENSSTTYADETDLIAALYVGAMRMQTQYDSDYDKIFVEGVVPDYTKTTEEKNNEISYGCLYQIAEQEVSDATN